ncbi:MAG: adenine phosphoribosyltransferase [Gemmatimonadaceae bacterium]
MSAATGGNAGADLERELRARIRDIADFPTPGIVFKDITPVLADADLFARVIDAMAAPFARAGVTHVAAIESRGFILGGPIARLLRAGFIPIRKRGKLPSDTVSIEYALEYGSDVLEIHADALGNAAGAARVLVVDDVLATGGTASAACKLIERVGGEVSGLTVLIALSFLPGVVALGDRRLAVAVTY